MRAGALDRKIEIVAVTASPIGDQYGQPITTEAVIANPWAQLIQQSAKEFLREGVTTTETRAVFRIRYPFANEITTNHVIRYSDRTWDITEVREIGRRKGLDLYCVART